MSAHHSRRRLFGTGASLLLLGSAAAGEAKAQELDGELLTLCAAFAQTDAEQEAYNLDPRDTPEMEALGDALHDRWWGGLNAITAISAHTPEGIRAKAHATRLALKSLASIDGSMDDAEGHERLAWSLMNDILRRADGA